MIEQKDYYEYWGRRKRKDKIDREVKCLDILGKIVENGDKIVDLGCGCGDFMLEMGKKFKGVNVEGFEFSKSCVRAGAGKNLNISFANFNKKIPLKNNSVDIAYAGEIIEHLFDPDLFLEETNRILKKEGYLLISTPNLCAWFNRILLLLGIQPLFLEPSTKSKLVGAGVLGRFKKESVPVGHVRIFTLDALRDLLKMNGFEIVMMGGAIFDEGLPKIVWPIDRLFCLFPSLSSNLLVLVWKKSDPLISYSA